MIKYHPSQRQLEQFVAGQCSPAWSLVISAHVDMCAICQQEVASISAQMGNSEFSLDEFQAMDPQLESMLSDIMELEPVEVIPVEEEPQHLELDGRFFELPRALSRVIEQTESWSKLVGKLWQAPVDLGEYGKGHFIYMEKGGSVPEHTHKGNELTLVINGEFEDGRRCYDSGDFILLGESDTHTPVATSDDGCLVFSFIDQPLHFTSGLARLLNPFSHLFFK